MVDVEKGQFFHLQNRYNIYNFPSMQWRIFSLIKNL